MAHQAYFEAVAQLIPLLVVVVVVEDSMFKNVLLWWPLPAACLALLLGEGAALWVLASGHSNHLALLVTTYGLCLGASMFGLRLLSRSEVVLLDDARREEGWRRREAGENVHYWSNHPEAVVAGLLALPIVFGPVVVALWVTVAVLL